MKVQTMRALKVDRRFVLQALGQTSLAALLALGISLLRSDGAKAAREALIQPPEIRSHNGELQVTLTAAPSPMQLGDAQFPGFLYNKSYLPPLLGYGSATCCASGL
jgi:hypothetical protein